MYSSDPAYENYEDFPPIDRIAIIEKISPIVIQQCQMAIIDDAAFDNLAPTSNDTLREVPSVSCDPYANLGLKKGYYFPRYGTSATFNSEGDRLEKEDEDEARRIFSEFREGNDTTAQIKFVEKHRYRREVLFLILRLCPFALTFFPRDLRENLEFVCNAIKEQPLCYAHIPEIFNFNERIAASAIKAGIPICDPLKNFPNSREVMLALVSKFPMIVCKMNAKFRHDREIIYRATLQCGRYILYGCKHLRNDENLVVLAVCMDPTVLLDLDPKFRDNERVITAALSTDGRALRLASKRICSNKWMVFLAVRCDKTAIEYASKGIRLDPDIMRAAGLLWG